MAKILLISDEFPPKLGGLSTVGMRYANIFSSQGHTITVLTRKRSPSPNVEGFTLLELRALPKLWILSYWIFLKKHNLKQYDHIILSGFLSVVIAGFCLKKNFLKKAIAFIQGYEIELLYKNKNFLRKLTINNLFHLHLYHKKVMYSCRKIVSVSHAFKQKFIKNTKFNDLQDKIEVIHTGISSKIFHFENSSLRKTLGISPRKIVLISVSRIERDKGYLEKLEIFEQLIRYNSDFHWMILGTGSFTKDFKKIIAEKNLGGFISLAGKIELDSLKYYYSVADCFWLLSNCDETFGLVYLEAQACDTPAIGRRKGGVVEAILHNKTGFLVNSDQECLELLKKQKFTQIKKSDIRNFVVLFQEQTAAKKLLE